MSVIISVDIETNGLVAGVHSMISLGAAALDTNTGEIKSTFSKNINPVPWLKVDTDTMNWWKQFPEAYSWTTEGTVHPQRAMEAFDYWLFNMDENRQQLNGNRATLAAWKPAFDVAFIRWYNEVFFPAANINARSSFGLDIKTVVATAMNVPYSSVKIGTIPDSFRVDDKGQIIKSHDHRAVNDAVEQAHVLYNAMRKLGVEL